MAKEKAAKHIPIRMRRNWPIRIGFIASSKTLIYLSDKRKFEGEKVIWRPY